VSRLAGLTAALIDDAAVFPPGDAPLPDAVTAAYGRSDSPTEHLVGPLLVPASATAALRELADPRRILRVALIGDTGLEGLEAARDALQDDPWIELAHVELAVPRDPDLALSTAQLLERLSFTVPAYLELPLDQDPRPALDVLAADGVERAKFRCGPDVIPATADLARGVSAAVAANVPFKLTGGLHHALPSVEGSVRHHGFLNALAATALALAGAEVDHLVAVLDSDDVATVLTALDTADVGRVRRQFRSFGSCSIAEPYDDLVRLGLQEES
jgi:hypothetical protein